MRRTAIRLVISLAVPQLVGAAGALATAPAIDAWYAGLNKPAFTPPSYIFGPAWITLYLLMGLAFFLVWQRLPDSSQAATAMILFAVQLGLNLIWSVLFFGLRSPILGLFDIVLLWLMLVVTMVYFFRTSIIAGLMLVPYILWVTFAAALNWAIWRLN